MLLGLLLEQWWKVAESGPAAAATNRLVSTLYVMHLHIARLHENFTFAHRPAMEALTNMAARFQSYGADAQAMALKQMTQVVHRQGAVMAFADVFFALTLLFVALAALAVLVKKPAAPAGAGGGH